MKWKLPPARDFGWKMKPLESARTKFNILRGNVYELTIEHSTVRGVTPAMLLWWFRNIGGDMEYDGRSYPRYLVWHPDDHIHWALARPSETGGADVGAAFHIVEAFARNPAYIIDSVETVEKLDETGIRLTRRIAGHVVFSLEHWFSQGQDGAGYNSQMIVGSSSFPLGSFFTRCVRPFIFTRAMGHAWLRHNIEEVGNFEFFLPEFFARTNHPVGGA